MLEEDFVMISVLRAEAIKWALDSNMDGWDAFHEFFDITEEDLLK